MMLPSPFWSCPVRLESYSSFLTVVPYARACVVLERRSRCWRRLFGLVQLPPPPSPEPPALFVRMRFLTSRLALAPGRLVLYVCAVVY